MRNKNHTPFSSALVIARNRRHMRRDRDALSSAGVPEIRVSDNPRKALASLVDEPVGVILLDEQLGDVSGTDVLRVLRGHPKLSDTPVVVTGMGEDRTAVFDALAAGCSGYLVRPYSEAALLQQLRRATGSRNPDTARLAAMRKLEEERRVHQAEASLRQGREEKAEVGQARALCEEGMQALAMERYGQAAELFSGALAVDPQHVEAHIGMASALQGQGNDGSARKSLRRAAKAYAGKEQREELKALVSNLLSRQHGVANPFIDLGFELVRQADYDSAARVYALAARYAPSAQEVNSAAARACMFTDSPQLCARRLSSAMRAAGSEANAHGIVMRIMGDLGEGQDSACNRFDARDSNGSFAGDVWEVVKATCRMFVTGRPADTEPLQLDLL